MIPVIYSLVPRNYSKKIHKSQDDFHDVEQFSIELEKKVVDSWNYKFELDKSKACGYKIKFDQFEKKFLKKSDFVIYIVNSVSKPSFKNSIEKLVKTCKDLRKLNKVLVCSLCPQSFEELNNTPIEVIYFGEDWQTEFPKHQWESLEDTLKSKMNVLSQDESRMTKSLTIPRSGSGRKSPSRIKSFFYSLPTRFEAERKGHLFSENSEKLVENSMSAESIKVPNIHVVNSANMDNVNDQSVSEHKHKVDFTKLSLNSLFRKRSKKTRDSGLSIDSSTSNGSGSRKSDTLKNRDSLSADVLYDIKQNPPSSHNQSRVILTANVTKTEKYKAKIEFFKSKANKVMKSTSCLQSPSLKRSKPHIADGMNQVVHFSSAIITAASDIGKETEETLLKRKNHLTFINNRSRSEPPREKFNHLNSDFGTQKRIKYYSWNEGSNEEEEFIIDHLKYEVETTENVDKNSYNENINDFEKIFDEFDTLDEDIYNDEKKIGNFEEMLEAYNGEFTLNQENFDKSFVESDISYSTFIPSQALNNKENPNPNNLIECHNIKLTNQDDEASNKIENDDPVESLNELIKSIRESCEEIQTNKKAKEVNEESNLSESNIINNRREFNQCMVNGVEEIDVCGIANFELLDDQNERIEQDNSDSIKEEILEKDENVSLMNFQSQSIQSYHEMSPELIAVGESLTKSYHNSTNLINPSYYSFMRNPFVVYGLFTTTALIAPIWSIYMPRNIYLPKVFYRIIDYFFYNGIVQLIPNQIIGGRLNNALLPVTE